MTIWMVELRFSDGWHPLSWSGFFQTRDEAREKIKAVRKEFPTAKHIRVAKYVRDDK